jgi:NADPH:quinone reductase-like Zn-dependent oxidoreductase
MQVPKTMMAVVTTGNGGYDKLVYKKVPTPVASPGEVLLQVLAAGVNNTEINTRLGWYSKTVATATNLQAAVEEEQPTDKEDGGWNERTPFPLIQGTDCCGRVVAVADPSDAGFLVGKRVLVRPCMRGAAGFSSMENLWMASDFDGAFAQFVKVPASEVFPVACDWSDVELGSIPCAYGSAENMVHRAEVKEGDRVLVPGASGGVGSATVQLAKRRGAKVTGICGRAKAEQVRALGADRVLTGRYGDTEWNAVVAEIKNSADVVIDNVGGDGFPDMIEAMKRGGRYATSGAISGPLVGLDLRTMYLRDLTLIGCTAWDEPVFPNLVGYIERGEIKPIIARTFPLENIADAQRAFLEKKHVGKFVLLPPPVEV